jgi:hypothetical protein
MMSEQGSLSPTRLTHRGVVRVDVLGAAVRPGILYASPGGAFELHNQTASVIDVFLTGGSQPQVVTIAPDEVKGLTLQASEGIYPFAVFSHEAGDFARGNSSPRVIIK